MTTLLAQADDALLSAEQRKLQHRSPESALSFTVSLNADRRRVFHVLTISEYMETWLAVPGRHPKSPLHVVSSTDGFHIRYFDEMENPTTLVGAYQTFRTAKTNFLWRRAVDLDPEPSIVKIRLNGDFERTTLSLTHTGLKSGEDLQWHSQLWEQSLDKLTSLFELQ